MQSRKELEKLIRQCETCFNIRKLSGNHGSFEDCLVPARNEGSADIAVGVSADKENKAPANDLPLPFSDFVGNNASLLHPHEFVHLHPNVFEKVTGKLPLGAFQEIDGEKTTVASISTPHKKRRKTADKTIAIIANISVVKFCSYP